MTNNANAALQQLRDGNERYVSSSPSSKPKFEDQRQAVVGGQSPFAIVVSCADSRVVPEQIFGAALGEIFTIRVAGNVANTSSIASAEYAVANLKTPLLVVMAHESCGAVTAAVAGEPLGPNLDHLLDHIKPAVAAADSKDVNAVARTNAALNAEAFAARSEIIRNAVAAGGLQVVSAYYSLSTGRVDLGPPGGTS